MMRDPSAPAANATGSRHVPVMLPEVLTVLKPSDGATYVDGTFGAGGYTTAILNAADCRVWAIDRDPKAVADGAVLASGYSGRLNVIEGRFGDMDRLLQPHGINTVDGIALDLGISSMQIDQPERGFSFQANGPLDMRMEGGHGGATAADVINRLSEGELADVIFRFGEERKARRVARAIVAARLAQPIERTHELAKIVQSVVKQDASGIDPATRTFQALRIYVNDELGEIERGLRAAERLLKPGGRLAVVAFHSLEDRAVKTFLKERYGQAPRGSRHLPQPGTGPVSRQPTFKPLFKGVRKPGDEELRHNPRARSARLRAAERTAAPAWQEETAA